MSDITREMVVEAIEKVYQRTGSPVTAAQIHQELARGNEPDIHTIRGANAWIRSLGRHPDNTLPHLVDDANGRGWVPVSSVSKPPAQEVAKKIEPLEPEGEWFFPGLRMNKTTKGPLAPVLSSIPVMDVQISIRGLSFNGLLFYSTEASGEKWQVIREKNFLLCLGGANCPKGAYRIHDAKRLKISVPDGKGNYTSREGSLLEGYELWVEYL